MKNIFCFFAAFVFYMSAFGMPADSLKKANKRQKRYHVNYWVTGSIIGVGMVGDFFAISRLKNKEIIPEEELAFLNSDQQRNLMNSFDRWVLNLNTSDRDLWIKISDYGQTAIFLLPSLLMIDKNMRKDWYDLLLMYVEGHTVAFTFYNYSFAGPTFQNRYRPIAYYPEFPVEVRRNGGNRNSFFSGHVGSCTFSTFFMAKVYCDYHPDLGAKKYLLYLAASVPPLVIGYARVKALAHFPSDVAVGFALGAIIGIVLPELHKNRKFKDFSLGMFDTPEATGVSVKWKFANQTSH
jgi:membrane-associated phospholipid phosphatase